VLYGAAGYGGDGFYWFYYAFCGAASYGGGSFYFSYCVLCGTANYDGCSILVLRCGAVYVCFKPPQHGAYGPECVGLLCGGASGGGDGGAGVVSKKDGKGS